MKEPSLGRNLRMQCFFAWVNTEVTNMYHRQNRLRSVYTHFKSCDESLDKTSFDFSDIFRTLQSCAMNAKSRIILKPPNGMVT